MTRVRLYYCSAFAILAGAVISPWKIGFYALFGLGILALILARCVEVSEEEESDDK